MRLPCFYIFAVISALGWFAPQRSFAQISNEEIISYEEMAQWVESPGYGEGRIFSCLNRDYPRFHFSLSCTKSLECEIKVTWKVNGEGIYTFKTFELGAFIVNDTQGMLYYTQFEPYATGMTLIAYDLENKKQVWSSALQALGPISSDKYANYGANLEFTEDGKLYVKGKESAGQYIEIVDPVTGKTSANKKRVFGGQ